MNVTDPNAVAGFILVVFLAGMYAYFQVQNNNLRARLKEEQEKERWLTLPVFFTFKDRKWQALVRISTQGKYAPMFRKELRVCIPNDGEKKFKDFNIPILGAPRYRVFGHEDNEILLLDSVYIFAESEPRVSVTPDIHLVK